MEMGMAIVFIYNVVHVGPFRLDYLWNGQIFRFFSAITTTIAAYRGKSSLWEYLAAGGCTGALYKLNMGLKGMASGGIVGSALGGIAGLFTLGLLKLAGTSMEDVLYWQYKMQLKRLKVEKDAWAVESNYSPPPLEMNHTLRVGTDKLSLDVIDALDKQLQHVEKKSINKSPETENVNKSEENKK